MRLLRPKEANCRPWTALTSFHNPPGWREGAQDQESIAFVVRGCWGISIFFSPAVAAELWMEIIKEVVKHGIASSSSCNGCGVDPTPQMFLCIAAGHTLHHTICITVCLDRYEVGWEQLRAAEIEQKKKKFPRIQSLESYQILTKSREVRAS